MKSLSTPLLALFIGVAALLIYAGYQVEARRSGATSAADAASTVPALLRGEIKGDAGSRFSFFSDAGPVGRDRRQYALAPALLEGCLSDDDCVRVDADCCGLAGGGRCAFIPRSHVVEQAEARVAGCRDIACPSVLSQDPSCRARAECRDRRCTVVDAPDAATFGIGIKPIE